VEDPRRRQIALFGYALVRPATDPDLSPAERGRLVRDLAARDHCTRTGSGCGWAVPRWTGGSAATASAGSTRCCPPNGETGRAPTWSCSTWRCGSSVSSPNAPPRRSIDIITRSRDGQTPSARTLQPHFARLGLDRQRDGRRFVCSAGSRLPGATTGGPVMCCTVRSSKSARPICSRSSTTTHG
jgi:putative transposase